MRTDPKLRRRGYAKRIVSFAAAHILACGRIATCTTERENIAMIRAAESVGFILGRKAVRTSDISRLLGELSQGYWRQPYILS